MENEIDIVRDVSQRLEQGGFSFMLTGSMAMNYYATPRMTRDIDLVVALRPNDAEQVENLFTPDYYVAREAIDQSMFNLVHQASVIKVDVIIRKSSPYRLGEFNRRERIQIEDFSTWIVSKEDLIISKLWWAKDSRSEIQLQDVANLIATGIDDRYIEKWITELGLQSLWREIQT